MTGTQEAAVADVRSPRVKEARRLARRVVRDRTGHFLVEGPQAVREAAEAPGRVLELFAVPEAVDRHPRIVAAVGAGGGRVTLVTEQALAALAETITPQGLVAVCVGVGVRLADVLALQPRLVAVLAGVSDPGNAGTVIRCADAAGADAVVVGAQSVDVHNGKCVRASAGSLFHLPIAPDVPLDAALPALHGAGLTVLVADGAGTVDLDAAADDGLLAGPVAWVFGNEAHGVPAEVVDRADAVVRIPIHGRAESLNLASAAAVCLYATARAHRR